MALVGNGGSSGPHSFFNSKGWRCLQLWAPGQGCYLPTIIIFLDHPATEAAQRHRKHTQQWRPPSHSAPWPVPRGQWHCGHRAQRHHHPHGLQRTTTAPTMRR